MMTAEANVEELWQAFEKVQDRDTYLNILIDAYLDCGDQRRALACAWLLENEKEPSPPGKYNKYDCWDWWSDDETRRREYPRDKAHQIPIVLYLRHEGLSTRSRNRAIFWSYFREVDAYRDVVDFWEKSDVGTK